MECLECKSAMNLIDDNKLWFCPMGCTRIANTSPLEHGAAEKISLSFFLSYFFKLDEPFWIFAFSPKDVPEQIRETPQKIQTTIAELSQNKTLQARLKRLNETQGIYFVVNSGGTKKEDITRINAAFCEIDDLPIADQHDLFDNAPFPPSIRVETKKSVHAYWLPGELLEISQFHEIQAGLIDYFNSDKALKNENRLMRLPFFNHVSFDAGEYLYKRVEIHTFSNTAFSAKEMLSAFPVKFEAIIEPKFAAMEYNTRDNVWQELFTEMQSRFRSLPGYHVERCGKLASANGICHHGETNRSLVMNLKTGVIFCRNECSFDEILRGLNLERPVKAEKKFVIPRVSAPLQTSELYKWITQGV